MVHAIFLPFNIPSKIEPLYTRGAVASKFKKAKDCEKDREIATVNLKSRFATKEKGKEINRYIEKEKEKERYLLYSNPI